MNAGLEPVGQPIVKPNVSCSPSLHLHNKAIEAAEEAMEAKDQAYEASLSVAVDASKVKHWLETSATTILLRSNNFKKLCMIHVLLNSVLLRLNIATVSPSFLENFCSCFPIDAQRHQRPCFLPCSCHSPKAKIESDQELADGLSEAAAASVEKAQQLSEISAQMEAESESAAKLAEDEAAAAAALEQKATEDRKEAEALAQSAEAEKQKAADDAQIAQEHADAALKAQEEATKLKEEALNAQQVRH